MDKGDQGVIDRVKRALKMTQVVIDPPRAQDGRSGIAVVAIVNNEARFIAEWAIFHASAGVRHFYIYDNGCTDGTIAALQAALPAAQMTMIPWDQKFRLGFWEGEVHNQMLAYAHATRNFGGAYRWMTWIDIDEFLVPKTETLPEALAPLEAYPMISLPWHMFGRGGHEHAPQGGVVPNFLRRNPDPMARSLLKFKVICDPCQVSACKVHWMEVGGKTDSVNDRGVPASLKGRNAPGFYSAERIQLNHYYTRSQEDLARKMARGPNLSVPTAAHERRMKRKVANIEAAEIEDTTAALWWALHRKDPA
jgi:hypothetical protein